MPNPKMNIEWVKAQHRTRQALVDLDRERKLMRTLFKLCEKSYARRLSEIQSACYHDWEPGLPDGRTCKHCGLLEP